jgi:cell division transport system permease protein
MAVNVKYFLKESTSSMWRNMALTAAAIMVTGLSLILLGWVGMTVHAGNGLASHFKESVDQIRVFLKDDITVEEQKSMDLFIRNMSEVKSVQFISKDQALQEFKDMYKDKPAMVNEIEGNPFPPEFKVRMKDPKYNAIVAQRIQARPEVSVDPDTHQKEIKFPKDVVQKVLRWTGAIQKVGFVLVVIFALVALALVFITIRVAIYSRRKEIGIMKLVGATNWFIRWPFIIEGMLEGFGGALVGILAAVLFDVLLITRFEAAAENSSLVSGGYMALLAFFLILAGVVIGAIGSLLALRRYIEV